MAMIENIRWQNAINLLCIRLDSLGDVLMTEPALRALKESNPARHITLLTSASGAEATRLIPEVDEVIVYESPWVKSVETHSDPQPEFEMVEQLRQKHFDAAVILTVFSQNPLPAAFLCHLAGIPLRLAYCRENPYQLLTDWVPEVDKEPSIRHEVRRQLDLVAAIGSKPVDEDIHIEIPSLAYSHINLLLEARGWDLSRPWLVMHTGASAPSRRYPAQGFAEVARILAQEHDLQVVFTGSPAETRQVEEIRRMVPAPTISLAGLLGVEELGALICMAPLLISNNSGPVHLASAVSTPVVDLYALTNPQHTPWRVPHRVLFHDVPCKYCYHSICHEGHHNCLRLVTPGEVVKAALELLQETAGISPKKLPLSNLNQSM